MASELFASLVSYECYISMWLASGTFIKACAADWHHCGEGTVTAVELQVLIQEHTIFMFPQCEHIWVRVEEKK